MKSSLAAALAIALLAPHAHGQVKTWGDQPAESITIAAPVAAIPAGPSVQLAVEGLTDDELASTSVSISPGIGASVIPAKSWGNKPILVFGALTPGKYTITITLHPENDWRLGVVQSLDAARSPKMSAELLAEYEAFAAGFRAKLVSQYPHKSGSCVVEVAGTVPNPPKPPTPTPTPGENPFPMPGLRLLILEEIQARHTLPRSQVAVLNSTALRAYMDAHAAKGANGNIEFRQLDDDFSDADLKSSGFAEMWIGAYRRGVNDSAGKVPWCVVSNGTKWESRALPNTEAEMLDLLKTYEE